MDDQAHQTLGQHIQALRQHQGVSLSKLAAAAGIAKSNLSRIEQGIGNPTLDTLWRLANELHLPFGELVAPLNGGICDKGTEVRLIERGTSQPNIDVYWVSMGPETVRQAEAHRQGTVETITLINGELTAGTARNARHLSCGQSFSFSADAPHSYQTHATMASYIVVIAYPSVRSTDE